jgi:hypothetical protein
MIGRFIVLWILLCCAGTKVVGQADLDSSIESISTDPNVLQLKVFLPKADAINIGPNLTFGRIDNKPAVLAQLSPTSNRGTDFILRKMGVSWDITFRLEGDKPPYKVEFEQSLSPAAKPKKDHQQIEFPVGKLTRARLFDTFDVRGFYGNPAQKRP